MAKIVKAPNKDRSEDNFTIFLAGSIDMGKAKKWGKRAAFFAVFGVTGTIALLAYNMYRVNKGLDKIDLGNLKL